jgi:hypothetical protein
VEGELFKFLKPKDIQLQFRVDSPEAFVQSVSTVMTEIINTYNFAMEELLRVLGESQLYHLAISQRTLQLLIARLDAQGIIVDQEDIRKEANDYVEREWPEIKKKLQEELAAARKVNEIFDKKTGEQP